MRRIYGLAVLAIVCCGSGATWGEDLYTPLVPMSSSGGACVFTPGSCPHRGGDRTHNECADREPPNVVWNHTIGGPRGPLGEGCDVNYGGIGFDALAWDSQRKNPRVWEIKTADWSRYDAFPKERELQNDIDLFIKHCVAIVSCNHEIRSSEQRAKYIMALADSGLYHTINDYFVKNPGKLPAGASESCSTQNVQGCRR